MTSPVALPSPAPVAWWRVKMVWLVIAGPLTVVLAGIVTTVIAFQAADPVVTTPVAARAHDQAELSAVPAQQARNHTAAVPAPN